MGDGPHPTDSRGQDGEYSLPLSVAGKTDENGQRFVSGSNARTGSDRRFLPPVREVSSSVWVLVATTEVSQHMVRWHALWPCVECVRRTDEWAVWNCQYWHDTHCSGSLSTASSVGSLMVRGLNVQSGHCEGWN